MKRLPPPVLVVVAAIAQKGLVRDARPATSWRRVASAVLGTASAGLAAAAAGTFRGQGTTVDPLHPERASALVTSGPNAFTRNPMYVGLAGLLTANAVRLGAWQALLPAVAFVAVVDRFQVAAEEQALRGAFGADYEAYCAAVPRWLGVRTAR